MDHGHASMLRPLEAIYCEVYGHAQRHLRELLQPVLHILEHFGCGVRRDRSRFDDALLGLVLRLRTASEHEPPLSQLGVSGGDKRRFLVTQVLLGFGLEASVAAATATHLMAVDPGVLVAARQEGQASTVVAARFVSRVATPTFAAGVRLRDRLGRMLRVVEAPYAGPDAVIDLLGRFPDVANPVYAAMGWTLEGFPPEVPAADPSEPRRFAIAVRKRVRDERLWERVRLVGLIVAGVAATVITAGAAGPIAATLAGAGIGVVQGAGAVIDAASDLQATRDAALVGAASAEHVEVHEHALAGAWTALAVNVVTLGAMARFGGGTVATQLVRGTAIGAAGGAASTMLDPATWAAEDTLGVVLVGTLLGGAGATLGAVVGVGGQRLIAGTAVQIGITRRVRAGDRIRVSFGPDRAPAEVELVGASGNRIRFVMDDRPYEVMIARVVALSSDDATTTMLVRALSTVRPLHAPVRGPARMHALVLSTTGKLDQTMLKARLRHGATSRISPTAGRFASADTMTFRAHDGQPVVAFRGLEGAAHMLYAASHGRWVLSRVDGARITPETERWVTQIARGGVTGSPAHPFGTVQAHQQRLDLPPHVRSFVQRIGTVFERQGNAFDAEVSRLRAETGVVGPLTR